MGHPQTKGNEQWQEVGFKMQKCPLCDKKVPEEAKFCSQCGWDLTEHELTPLQIARIQDEIQEARSRAMEMHVGMVPFSTIGLACILVAMFALFKVIPEIWDFMLYPGLAFVSIEIAFGFGQDRYKKKQDRLKMMLRDRRPFQ